MKKIIEKEIDEQNLGFMTECQVKGIENEWDVLCDCKLMLLPSDYMHISFNRSKKIFFHHPKKGPMRRAIIDWTNHLLLVQNKKKEKH